PDSAAIEILLPHLIGREGVSHHEVCPLKARFYYPKWYDLLGGVAHYRDGDRDIDIKNPILCSQYLLFLFRKVLQDKLMTDGVQLVLGKITVEASDYAVHHILHR